MYKFPLSTYRQFGWCCLAWSCLGLGTVGAFVPLLPTTPFILLAAWAAPKGSTRLDHWLLHHPRFGPLLIGWRQERALPLRAKALAVTMLMLSWAILWWLQAAVGILLFLAVLFSAVAAYLLSRPNAQGTGL